MGLTRDVTHLFAVSPHSEKYATAMSYRGETRIKVLVPDWFDDSVLLGIPALSTDGYEWPDPAVLNRRPGTSKQQQRNSMSPQKKKLYETASWDSNPSQPKLPKIDSKDVWSGRRILLSTSLELVGSRRRVVEVGIKQCKGVPVKYISGDGIGEEELSLLDDCDVFITRYRTGPAFFQVRVLL